MADQNLTLGDVIQTVSAAVAGVHGIPLAAADRAGALGSHVLAEAMLRHAAEVRASRDAIVAQLALVTAAIKKPV